MKLCKRSFTFLGESFIHLKWNKTSCLGRYFDQMYIPALCLMSVIKTFKYTALV